MKLTKRQRHSYYKKALTLIKDGTENFICVALNRINGLKHSSYGFDRYFPELHKRKPKVFYSNFLEHWWNPSNKSIRVKTLNKCIEETRPIKKKIEW